MSPCVPNGLNIVTVAASVLTAGTAFGGIVYFLLLTLSFTVTVVVNVLYGKV